MKGVRSISRSSAFISSGESLRPARTLPWQAMVESTWSSRADEQPLLLAIVFGRECVGEVLEQSFDVTGAEQRRHLAHDERRRTERLDHEPQPLQVLGSPKQQPGRLGVELDDFGDQQQLPRDPPIGEGSLQPLIDEAFMRGVLVNDDERILGLGDDEGVVELRARGAERVIRPERRILSGRAARVAARLGKRIERRLGVVRKSERLPAPAGRRPISTAAQLRPRSLARTQHAVERRLRERRRCAVPRGLERLLERRDDERAHGVRIAEPELALGRMHVHVDLVRRQVEEQSEHRIAALRHEVAVGSAHRADQQLVAHRPPVDHEIKLERIRPVERRQTRKSLKRHPTPRDAQGERIGRERLAENARQPRERVIDQPCRAGFEPQTDAVLAPKAEADLGLGEREPLDHIGNCRGLGALRFHEFEPGGRRVEQVAHLDPRAAGKRRGLQRGLASRIDGDLVSLGSTRGAACNGKPGDRADRGQRLAAEAERHDAFEIVARELGRCVAFHR